VRLTSFLSELWFQHSNSQKENIVDGLDYEIFVMHHALQ
jgi:hypothetical protein